MSGDADEARMLLGDARHELAEAVAALPTFEQLPNQRDLAAFIADSANVANSRIAAASSTVLQRCGAALAEVDADAKTLHALMAQADQLVHGIRTKLHAASLAVADALDVIL